MVGSPPHNGKAAHEGIEVTALFEPFDGARAKLKLFISCSHAHSLPETQEARPGRSEQ